MSYVVGSSPSDASRPSSNRYPEHRVKASSSAVPYSDADADAGGRGGDRSYPSQDEELSRNSDNREFPPKFGIRIQRNCNEETTRVRRELSQPEHGGARV